MDGQQPPPPPPSAPARGGGGGVFTRKIGPLPMWVWLVIIGGLVVAYALYTRGKNPQAPQPQDTGGQDSGAGAGVQQVYLTGTPAGQTTPAVPSPTGDSSQGPIIDPGSLLQPGPPPPFPGGGGGPIIPPGGGPFHPPGHQGTPPITGPPPEPRHKPRHPLHRHHKHPARRG